MQEHRNHQPVLYQEILNILQPKKTGVYVDGTLGAGGHAFGILSASSPTSKLIGFEIDLEAVQIAKTNLKSFGNRVSIHHTSYVNLPDVLIEIKNKCVDGIILDLGLSSMQLDRAHRGFSFKKDAPLDMRFDPTKGQSASELLNRISETELSKILKDFGEEKQARAIAKTIIANRPINTTRELTELVRHVYKGKRGRIHPATKTFQALRIAVNDEIMTLKKGLSSGLKSLCSGGRMAVISFHSLEDRIVKQYFRQESTDCICPPNQPICTCDHKASVKLVTRKPITPTKQEILENPRSRSAKLRSVEKI